MRNRDKYQLTNDAIEAWDKYHDGGGDMPFDKWLKCEFEDPSAPTLQEAAEGLINVWEVHGSRHPYILKKMLDLSDAVEREKKKPVRNFDRYKTAKEAYKGFLGVCESGNCPNCRFRHCETACACAIEYLYSEAKKEVSK